MSESTKKGVSLFVLILMASVTFIAILSELMPSGVLNIMASDLGIGEKQSGTLIGYYALASAVCAIPLVSATLGVNRKNLLIILMVAFAASNVVVGFSTSYALTISMRLIGGVAAGVLWPMIAAYGTKLVPPNQSGRAIAIIMGGNTLGVSIGLPIMTYVGEHLGWPTEFILLGVVAAIICLLSIIYLPSVPGEKLTKSNSPLAVLKNPSILIILVLTLLAVMAHYGPYTYVTSIHDQLQFPDEMAISLAIFGVGSIFSVLVAVKYTDTHLRLLTIGSFIMAAFAMLLFILFDGAMYIHHFALFIWGLSFGPLVTLLQTATTRQVQTGKDVATSVQSSTFNFSIMIATEVCGIILAHKIINPSVKGVLWFSLACFAVATLVALFATNTLTNREKK